MLELMTNRCLNVQKEKTVREKAVKNQHFFVCMS